MLKLMPPVISEPISYQTILTSIIDKNSTVGLDDIEALVNTFVKQLNECVGVIYYNKDSYPSASLINWRAGFEIVVLFRAWAQAITKSNDEELFYNLGERFIAYSDIVSNGSRLSKETIEGLEELPEHLRIEYTYDWLNPIFTKRELSNMYNKNHPSFRDIVERTNETNGRLRSMYSRYQEASKVIHFSMESIDIIESLDVDQLVKELHYLVFEFLMDYLTIIELLSPSEKLQKYARNSKRVIRKRLQ